MTIDELEAELATIRKRHTAACRAEVTERLVQHYKGRFPDIVSMDWRGDSIVVNGHRATHIRIDQYCNLFCKFPAAIPIYLLEPMGIWLEQRFERLITVGGCCYKYRAVQGLLIHYWYDQYSTTTAKDLLALLAVSQRLPCERNDHETYGFGAWLLTDHYHHGGAISDLEFRNWPHHEEFRELLKDAKLAS